MTSALQSAVIKTVAYADVFDYPLHLKEIKKYLIGYKLKGRNPLRRLSEVMRSTSVIGYSGGYYYLEGGKKSIEKREKKEKISSEKLKFARRIAGLLFLIPAVKCIALTGNLSLLQADRDDDIDFLIIAGRGSIWTARLISVLLLKLLRVYRHHQSRLVSDKICLNMYVDEDHLELPVSERDLYSAHEIVQMMPLFSRPGYENILPTRNPWIKKFLPNALGSVIPTNENVIPSEVEGSRVNARRQKFSFSHIIEKLAKNLQLNYMQSRRTSEIISEGYLRFHPRDVRPAILSAYNKNLKKNLS